MNTAIRRLTLIALAIISFNLAMAQKANYTTNSGMTIGFGLGGSYQQSDIANSRGAGFDFTLGSYIYKKENAFLSADWKFRFLGGENRAHDHRINTDGTYSNISYDFFNYDLELGLTLNRLRERTRIVVSGFAGAGITHGRTFTDLYDENDNLYDYSVIDPNLDRTQVYADLLNLSDKEYETSLVNKAAVIPTLGIFIGYQLTRSFSLGIEHKTNFSLTETNSVTGINIDNNIVSGSRRDRNHYTTLGFKWILRGRASRSVSRNTIPGVYTPPTTTKPVRPVTEPRPVVNVPAPVVDITVPAGNPYSTTVEKIDITARVKNVRSRQNIQVVLNSNNIGFEYNPGSGIVKSTLTLADGTNRLEIICANEAGSSRDNVTIICNKPVRPDPPVVKFINPATPVTVENDIYRISVQTANVTSWQDVTVTINGNRTNNFSLSTEGVVTTNVALKEGATRIEVSGKNDSGNSTDRTTITYILPVKATPPVVTILTPNASPYNTYEFSQGIRANISGVKGKEDISVSINGVNTGNFAYDNSTFTLNTEVSLNEGRNVITITAGNEAGQDTKSQVVIKETRPCPPPSVRMTVPAQNDITTDNQSYTFRTEVENITNKNQIVLTLNGRNITNFNFNGYEVLHTASLNAGSNSFVLVAKNNCGTQSLTSSIIYRPAEVVVEEPCVPPQVSFTVTEVDSDDTSYELKGSISNVKDRSEITITVNGNPFDGFQFVPNSGELSATFKFEPGSYTILVSVSNECGSDSETTAVIVEQPCVSPQVSFAVTAVERQDASHEMKGSVSNVENRSNIKITVNGSPFDGFQFVPDNGELNATFKFDPGSYTILVSVSNECGSDSETTAVIVEQPCVSPQVSFAVTAVERQDASHEMKGSVSNVENRSNIKITVNGSPFDGFQFVPDNGELNTTFKFDPGSYTIIVNVSNECGSDSETTAVIVEQPCVSSQVSFAVTAVERQDASHEMKGSVSNVENRSNIKITVNGSPFDGFQFNPDNGELSANFKLNPGSHTIIISVSNECGTDSKTTVVTVEQPCSPPQVSFAVTAVDRNNASHELKGTVSNVENRSNIKITVNGSPFDGFQFNPDNGELSANFKLNPGSHTIIISVSNECGTDSKTTVVTVEQPCSPPQVSFAVTAVDRNNASHELKGTVSHVKDKSGINLMINGRADNSFQYTPSSGELYASLKLLPGSNTINVTARNSCGQDSDLSTVIIKEEIACGIRINPGNSPWQFCLVTPSGTFSRESLTNSNFSYSGSATSLYFMPIAGGGNATVKGKPYNIRPGQYYLFTGNMTVTVSTKNSGSMGHWSICIITDKEPVSGNGKNRPKSPCEESQ